MLGQRKSAAIFVLDGSAFGFEGARETIFLNGPLFGGQLRLLGSPTEFWKRDAWIDFEVERRGSEIEFRVDGKTLARADHEGSFGEFGFAPWRSTMQIESFSITGKIGARRPHRSSQPAKASTSPISIPTIDLDAHRHRQVVVDREKGQYLGHPTTVVLEDQKTMLCVYPKGHGRGGIVYKRSLDAGLTWSDRLPTPKSWATSKEVPTIHRVVDAAGKKRLIMWSGLYPARLAVSEDDGATWSELEPVGDWGGIVVMGAVVELRTGPGHYLAMFHDDGRFFTKVPQKKNPVVFTLYKTFSRDGGLTWSFPEAILARSDVHLCEPGLVRSPDGKQLACLLRENSRRKNSHIVFSNDEGATWSDPRELPASLSGDRHTGKHAPDGRLFLSFRDRPAEHVDTPSEGDWVGWVGTYDDLVEGSEGQYRLRLRDNKKGADCAYPGVECLPDGTFVTTTYGHWDAGESPYILSVRFRLEEIDALAPPKPVSLFAPGMGGYPHFRIPSLITTKHGVVLAFSEARQGGDHSHNDIALRRSLDGGATWEPMRVIVRHEKHAFNNPTAISLRDDGRVLLFYQRYPDGTGERGVVDGFDGDRICATFLLESRDDGKTWAAPRDITRQVKREKGWTSTASGPGVAIELRRGPHKGRIVVPNNHGPFGQWHSYAFYSDDGGATWRIGGDTRRMMNECQVVELEDGALLLDMRNHAERGVRAFSISRDGGVTWSPSKDHAPLVGPRCQASLIRYSDPLDGEPSRLVFSNPASPSGRRAMTVRLSLDEGRSWPHAKTIHAGPSAYSCLTRLPDGSIGLLYEAGEKSPYESVRFVRVPLEWLTGKP